MAGFLYHFPDKTIGNWKQAIEAAPVLADVLDDCALSTSHSTFPGPGGQGTLCGVGDVAMRYDRDSQTWLDGGGWWLGWDRKDPPGPNDLARKNMTDGHLVRLLDGNDWLVPAIPLLPSGFVREDGELKRKPHARYADIHKFAQRVYDQDTIYSLEAFEMICRVLRINYRIPEAACLMTGLDLISDHEVNACVFAIMDGPTYKVQGQKKTG